MPYIVVRAESTVPENSHAVDRMVYVVDIYDNDSSVEKAETIARRIEKLLDMQRPALEGRTCLGVWRDFKGQVAEDDPEIQHIHLEFIARYGREDLLA